ncbi:MAG TPA: RNA polymerase sigma-70 factor [Actinomycetota bacterium]|nr:RNA polymerase sigma-70 factor [Actinomycetota bacterium]
MESPLEVFEELRPRMFGVAYRMLGSVSDAEDIVQEAFLRWRGAGDVRDPAAWLTTVVTRLCIDQLRSARAQREEYVGPWLPEPLVDEERPRDPSVDAELSDSLSLAFLVVLETLTPTERAAFILREVFDYPYPHIAELLETSEPNVRQLVHRAKGRVAERRSRFETDREKQADLLQRFLFAVGSGEVQALVDLLAADAVCYTDGGGHVRAARRPIFGADKVARFLVGVAKDLPLDVTSEIATVNGSAGLVMHRNGSPYGVITADTAGESVLSIYMVFNPEKLRALGRR